VINTAGYSIAKNHLRFVCHDEPDKDQEDFDCCFCRPDNSFLCENRYTSQQSEMWLYTYSKAVETPSLILSRCVVFPQQPWRGSNTTETELTYASTITTDIAD